MINTIPQLYFSGEKVGLNIKSIRIQRPSRKLD